MPLNRRSSDTSGYVNWPTHLTNTGEGGMFVRLVVEDANFTVCCGGFNYVIVDETFCGDDEIASSTDFDKDLQTEENYHFCNSTENETFSTPYICCLTIASTGASYYDDEKERNWLCTFNDLTDEGKTLYQQIQKLYPNGTITLQTWLDT